MKEKREKQMRERNLECGEMSIDMPHATLPHVGR